MYRKLTAVFFSAALLAGCNDASDKSASNAARAMPPTAVSFVEVAAETLPITNELPGRIAPTGIAEVRPRVSGILVERVFEQGTVVKEGDVLYRIDPRTFRVQVASAKATLQRAKATQLQARQQADRQKELRNRKVTSAQAFENATAQLAQADADVALAHAGLDAAELNLQFSEVRAPISGRIGRAMLTEGALVDPSGEVLATIQQLDPVYADFTQSANQLLRLRRSLDVGALNGPGAGQAKVRLLLDDGQEYAHSGLLLFSEATVDTTTGQITLRGQFSNPDGDLLPGMYVRVLIDQGEEKNAIAVPQQAVQRNAGGQAQVYMVGAEDKAELRSVETGRVLGSRWVITKGLAPGDKVIVEGFQKLRPGAPLATTPWAEASKTADLAAK
ncbi:efflux RND transporter periplasmic adaptor subunit [Stappia sp. ES.058]|uniref:efflux RND transporter periplasmic adaptor subunit n=1 Tax=Stappia sp. ES.058 TaxID=1881061 RepID=UPI00087ACEAA|nr:efflux RND transporter periplasmic adaptor subunit [Stappia sp. ES.058]SDU18374.1 membrane fusion protein, multidrug efflux system [Stappia sp. ES.058]